MVVRAGRAELVQLALHELGGLQGRHPVEVGQLVEGAVHRAFGGGAVVTDDVVDDRVVEDLEVLEGVDDPADVVVGVLQEPGEHLHLAGQHRLELVGHVVPRRDLGVAAGELGVGGDDAELLLAGEDPLALHVPAVVELTAVAVGPLLGDVVRRMGRPVGEVDEERLVRHQRLLLTHPADGPVGQVLGQVVALFGRGRRLDWRRPVVERRVPLVVLAADEPVERLEPTTTGRPGVERTHRRRLPHRHLVALAELRRRVSVQLQRHRQRRLGVRSQRVVAGRGRRRLGDAAHADRVMVAARQQRGSRRRAQGAGVEPVVPQPTGRQPFRRRHPARPPERGRRAEPDVVEQDDQHVGCPFRWQQRLDRRERRVGVLGVIGRQPGRRPVGDRQHRAGMPVRAHHVPPSDFASVVLRRASISAG